MQDSPATFNWLGLLQLFALWLLVVFAALRVLDLLFPRLRRDDGETPAAPATARQPLSIRPPRGAVGQAARAAPAAVQEPTARSAQVGKTHWQANRRTIGVMLLIWAGVSFLPAVFSPQLNQIQIFTGFPLGYYMGSQCSLVVFLCLITVYAWRTAQLDLRFRSAPWLPGGVREGRAATRRIGLIYVLFTIGFVLFALLMGGLEQQIGMPANLIGWALLIVTIGLYAVIGVANRAHTLDD